MVDQVFPASTLPSAEAERRVSFSELAQVSYYLALGFFFLTFLVDTGGREAIWGGIPLPHAAGAAVVVTGMLLWQPPRDAVIRNALALIAIWVLLRILAGDGMFEGFRVFSLIVLAVVVSGAAASQNTLLFHLRTSFFVLCILVLAYYAGFWSEWSVYRVTFNGFNPNQLSLLLVAGIVLGIGLFHTGGRVLKVAVLSAIPFFLPPLWMTGSRKAILLLMVILLIQFAAASGRKLVLWGVVTAVLALAFPGLLELALGSLSSSEVFRSRIQSLQVNALERYVLISQGFLLAMQRPWTGFGLDAPFTGSWRAENIGFYSKAGEPLMVHNGFIDYLLMGGIPLFLVCMVFFGRLTWLVWREVDRGEGFLAAVAPTVFALNVWFVAVVFFGDTTTKPGWWVAGLVLLFLRLSGAERKERSPAAELA